MQKKTVNQYRIIDNEDIVLKERLASQYATKQKKHLWSSDSYVLFCKRSLMISWRYFSCSVHCREWVSNWSSARMQNEEKVGQFPSPPESGLHRMSSLISLKNFFRTSDTFQCWHKNNFQSQKNIHHAMHVWINHLFGKIYLLFHDLANCIIR